MSAEDVNRSLNFMGMGFGRRPASSPPSASPFGGVNSQGTLNQSKLLFGGGVNVNVEGAGPARSSETSRPASMEEEGGIRPVCMFLTTLTNINDNCLGCVGTKGEKFCTKPKQGTGELDTCGTISHARKALVETDHIYFWDSIREHGYLEPAMDMTFSLSTALYDLRGAVLTRVQFNELIGLIKDQSVTTPDEFLEVKSRVTGKSGVSFTPRKKPRFSTDSTYEYVEADLLPTIEEAPTTPAALQEHIADHWSDMVAALKILKTMSLKHARYETEILRISEDIDTLNVSSSRMESLVGTPADGIQFNLFGIVDKNEEVLLEVGDQVNKHLVPRLTTVEKTAEAAEKAVKSFNSTVGDDVLKKLAGVESSVRNLEATSCPAKGPTFAQVRTVILDEIIPAVTDLWDLYMVATEGPGKALRPGSGKPSGAYLWSKLDSGSSGLEASPPLDVNSLLARIATLEAVAQHASVSTGGGCPSDPIDLWAGAITCWGYRCFPSRGQNGRLQPRS
jgi:hypothetical protein